MECNIRKSNHSNIYFLFGGDIQTCLTIYILQQPYWKLFFKMIITVKKKYKKEYELKMSKRVSKNQLMKTYILNERIGGDIIMLRGHWVH